MIYIIAVEFDNIVTFGSCVLHFLHICKGVSQLMAEHGQADAVIPFSFP